MNHNENRLDGTLQLFRYYKSLTEKSISQISDQQIHEPPQPDQHSIAILMKHLAGNMISRWTNFRTEDGEKPWRNRETEFVDDFESKDELMEYWEKGWGVLFDALESIEDDELDSIIYIRNDGHKLIEAIDVAYHTNCLSQYTPAMTGKVSPSPKEKPKSTTERNSIRIKDGGCIRTASDL